MKTDRIMKTRWLAVLLLLWCGMADAQQKTDSVCISHFSEEITDILDMSRRYSAKGEYQQAADCCKKALSLDASCGDAYILLAEIYASYPTWNSESLLNQCTYFLAIDKLQQAKEIDPSVTERANELLALYARETPKPKDLFMLGYRVGDRIYIGGWINESTIIR